MDGKRSGATRRKPYERNASARIVHYKGRPFGVRWKLGTDEGEITTGTFDRDEAIEFKAMLVSQLNEGYIPGRESEGPMIEWPDFRLRYQLEYLSSLSKRYCESWRTTANHVERVLDPKHLSEINKNQLSYFRGVLIEEGKSLASVKSYMATLQAALAWAVDVDLLDKVPKLRRLKGVGKTPTMRSRPTNEEEFERILANFAKERPYDTDQWIDFCKGLRYSGFRIDELRRLSWNEGDPLSIDQSHELPLIRMFAEGHKSRRDVFQPMTPEFWKLISKPGRSRSGLVFPMQGQRGPFQSNWIGEVIAQVGKRAGIITGEKGKTATSHDIGRRMFITHVAKTQGLSSAQKWARHSDPSTTANYYVVHDAIALAKESGW